MNILEKILEEIEKRRGSRENLVKYEKKNGTIVDVERNRCALDELDIVERIIRHHMGEVANMSGKRLIDANALDDEVMNLFIAITGNPKQTTVIRECKESFRRMIDEQPTVHVNDGWIPVSERLPEPDKIVYVTVHCSEWTSDYDSDWVAENEKVNHEEEYIVNVGYVDEDWHWTAFNDDGCAVCCDEEFGTDKGCVYSVVTAWLPLPEPYKGE